MNNLVVFNIFIILIHLYILVSRTTSSTIGKSSCMYLGEFDGDTKKCRKDVVKVDRLPETCTSYVYDGAICRQNYGIELKDADNGLVRLKSLVDYDDRAHPVFIHFSHGNVDEWHNVLFTGNFSLVAQNVQTFCVNNPVRGLILSGLEDQNLSKDGENFYQQFTAYVKAIKGVNKYLEIGLYLSARIFTDRVSGVDTTPYFDFLKINEIFDFYIIEFSTFNNCSGNSLCGGITPMQSSDPEAMTLNKFAAVLDNSTIAKDKLYFEFLISPKPKLEEENNFTPCEKSYNEYCENEDDKKSKWCVDTSDILYKKGAFSANHANGFIGRYIDLVDRDNKCGCGKYVTFDMMVNGFNQEVDPQSCEPLKMYS